MEALPNHSDSTNKNTRHVPGDEGSGTQFASNPTLAGNIAFDPRSSGPSRQTFIPGVQPAPGSFRVPSTTRSIWSTENLAREGTSFATQRTYSLRRTASVAAIGDEAGHNKSAEKVRMIDRSDAMREMQTMTFEANITTLQHELDATKRTLSEVKAENAVLRSEIERTREELSVAAALSTEAGSSIIAKELSRANEMISSKESYINNLQQQMKDWQNNDTRSQQVLDAQRSEIERLKVQLGKMTDSKAQLKACVTEISQLKRQLNQQTIEAEAVKADLGQKHQKELDDVRKAYMDKGKAFAEECVKKLTKSQDRTKHLELSLGASEDRVKHLEISLRESQDRVKHLELSLRASHDRVKNLEVSSSTRPGLRTLTPASNSNVGPAAPLAPIPIRPSSIRGEASLLLQPDFPVIEEEEEEDVDMGDPDLAEARRSQPSPLHLNVSFEQAYFDETPSEPQVPTPLRRPLQTEPSLDMPGAYRRPGATPGPSSTPGMVATPRQAQDAQIPGPTAQELLNSLLSSQAQNGASVFAQSYSHNTHVPHTAPPAPPTSLLPPISQTVMPTREHPSPAQGAASVQPSHSTPPAFGVRVPVTNHASPGRPAWLQTSRGPASALPNSTLPAPGSSTPRPRFSTANPSPARASHSALPQTPRGTASNLEGLLNSAPGTPSRALIVTGIQAVNELVDLVRDLRDNSPGQPRRPKIPNRDFSSPKTRTGVRMPAKEAMMQKCRNLMNQLLGITKDHELTVEIAQNHSATIAQVDEFERNGDDMADLPLEPLLIDWTKYSKKKWNTALGRAFAKRLCDANLDLRGQEDDIILHFMQRVSSLRRLWQAKLPQDGETAAQALERNSNQLEESRRLSRKRARVAAYKTSLLNLCEEFKGQFPILSQAAETIEELGEEMLSSDDSEDGGAAGTKQFIVRTMPYRNKKVVNLVEQVRSLRNYQKPGGSRRSGAEAIVRKRYRHAIATERKPPVGKRQNHYDSVWYTTLTSSQRDTLQAKPAKPFLGEDGEVDARYFTMM